MIKRGPIIQLTNIVQSYGERLVLDDISVDFADNQITTVLGKSGSGKTTLLQTINGMVKPTGGVVKIFGDPLDYETIHATRLQIGYVVQHVALFPHLTILENICLLGRIVNMQKNAMMARVSHLLESVQLPAGYLKKYPHQLSGGEQQRVGLCRAMFLNPSVVIMDEPFASLDEETKTAIYSHITTSQQNEPRTIVLVTHNMQEALSLADHFIWLKSGKLFEQGSKGKLRAILTENTDL